MIKFVVRPRDRGWAIYRDDAFVSLHPTQRQVLNSLAALRAELKEQGKRSLIKLEPRMKPKSSKSN